jgi:hypothetical protein
MKDNISELFCPIIKNVKLQVGYGKDIVIESDQAEVTSVTIIRPSSAKHSPNADQRCI